MVAWSFYYPNDPNDPNKTPLILVNTYSISVLIRFNSIQFKGKKKYIDRKAKMTSRITHLANIISTQTALIDNHLKSNNLPQPSFNPDAPTEPIKQATAEIKRAQRDVIEATIELRQLLEGPMKLVLPEVCLYLSHQKP